MKFLFIAEHVGFFRHFERVARVLCEQNHEVVLLFNRMTKNNYNNILLENILKDFENISIDAVIERNDFWKSIAFTIRKIINFSVYKNPLHPSKNLASRVIVKSFPFLIKQLFRVKLIEEMLTKPVFISMLRKIENIIPVDKKIKLSIHKYSPDAVIAVVNLIAHASEVDYLKAAKKLDIPTIISIASWDNLTTKGTFQIFPDYLFVWNEPQVREAMVLHDFPKEKIITTGAATFEFWNELEATKTRDEFCVEAGLEPSKPFILYLCSSTTIIEDEKKSVDELMQVLQNIEFTKGIQVLIRPHPMNTEYWNKISEENKGYCVFPAKGELPETNEAREKFYHSLHYCMATIGVNTSATLEAAIMNKPCISIITDEYKQGQADMGHFKLLLDGDFMFTCATFAESIQYLSELLEGNDRKSENRQRFINYFLRNNTMDTKPSKFISEQITKIASREWHT